MNTEAIQKALYIIGLIGGLVTWSQKIVKTHLEIKKLMKELEEEVK